MILLAIITMMFVNKDVKIPGTSLFIVCVLLMFVITIVGTFDQNTDVSAMSAADAARTIMLRQTMCMVIYILRPFVILTEVLIILQDRKHKLLCVIPAIINALIYSTAFFGSHLAFWISESNTWRGGPLSLTIYVTQFVYLLILLNASIQAFSIGDKRKGLILNLILLQAVLDALMEKFAPTSLGYTDVITALCILEYYIFLTNVYRQQLNEKLDKYVEDIEEAGIKHKALMVEVMEALASAIDAKDEYTHGHSSRVAEYSRKLAEMSGKNEQECDEIYYAALLHDVGKIGVSDSIITKEGKLTKEEYDEIKKHPGYGKQILERISEFPYLSIGAAGHHERYDGRGYPDGLKGTDIPEIARIISVADAYDAMSSKRSYRDPIPQQIVREELVKGAGTQFDPEFARLMLHLIDVDTEYEMCEREEVIELAGRDELSIAEYRSKISAGILITPTMTTLRMRIGAIDKEKNRSPIPSLILFDSLDGRVHDTDKKKKDLNYFEYGEIWFDGRTACLGARKIVTEITDKGSADIKRKDEYVIEAVKYRDHMLIKIIGQSQTATVIIALPDATRYTYIGLTGEYCRFSHVSIEKAEEDIAEDYIPRIAEEISYIKDMPEGDLPNVQIDGYRTDSSRGVEVKDGLKISFHSKCLPTARLVWHCPFIDIFTSDDGNVDGRNYRDLAFSRFDGEAWECDPNSSLKLSVKTLDSFEGWDAWKEFLREGFDAVVRFKVEGNTITIITENCGISIRNKVTITGIDKKIYVAITGDQIALTNIRLS